jgi:hypothetical protein
VRFLGAEIGGNLECGDASFQNKGGSALTLSGAKIMGQVLLNRGFQANGEVRLPGAEIGGNLDCNGASLQNEDGATLTCDGAEIQGTVFLSNGFKAEGTVRLPGAEIGADLGCVNGTFLNKNGSALICDGTVVKDTLFFRDGFKAEGQIDLSAARVGSLVDVDIANDKDGASMLLLDGFTYEHLAGGTPTDAKKRVAWLQRQPPKHLDADFRLQPFEQLAKVLRAMGHDRDAREIGFLKEKLFRPHRGARAGRLAKPFVRLQWWLYGLVAGYGYKPHRMLWILVALWLSCAMIYCVAAQHRLFAPSDPQIWTRQDLTGCRPPTGNWTHCPAAKELPPSADVLIPIVDMGQRKHWEPIKRKFLLHLPNGFKLPVPSWPLPWLVAVENVFGTLLVLLFGAIAAGLVKRD